MPTAQEVHPWDSVEGITPNRDPGCTAYFQGSFLPFDKKEKWGELMASEVIGQGPRLLCPKARPREQGSQEQFPLTLTFNPHQYPNSFPHPSPPSLLGLTVLFINLLVNPSTQDFSTPSKLSAPRCPPPPSPPSPVSPALSLGPGRSRLPEL